jgi:ribosomal protein S3
VLSRVPTFSRPLLGARFSVSGRLKRQDMASTVWASGGKLPRSWVSPKVNEDLLVAASKERGGEGVVGSTKQLAVPIGRLHSQGGLPESKAKMARFRSGGGLSYAAGKVATRYGSLGLKVWLFF